MARNKFPVGNTAAVKLKTPKMRKDCFADLVQHLSDGFSLSTFPALDMESIHYYLDNYPQEFPRDEFNAALRTGILVWERIGKAGTMGKLKGYNGGSWRFTMMNRAGWRYNVASEGSENSAPQKLIIEYAGSTDDDETSGGTST